MQNLPLLFSDMLHRRVFSDKPSDFPRSNATQETFIIQPGNNEVRVKLSNTGTSHEYSICVSASKPFLIAKSSSSSQRNGLECSLSGIFKLTLVAEGRTIMAKVKITSIYFCCLHFGFAMISLLIFFLNEG